MSDTGHDRREIVRAIFEQNSIQIRHLENQRLIYLLVYGLLWTAIIVIRGDWLFDFTSWPALTLLVVLSFFGLIFSLEIQRLFRAYAASAALIVNRYSLDHYLPGGPKENRQLPSGLSKLFPLFYLLGLSYSLFVLLQILFLPGWLTIILPMVVLVAGAVAILTIDHGVPPPPKMD